MAGTKEEAMSHLTEVQSELDQTEASITRLREERARAKKVFDAARKAVDQSGDDTEGPAFEAAMAAKNSVDEIDASLANANEKLTGQLRRMADYEVGRSGFTGGNGWETAARELDLGAGKLQVDVPASSLLYAAAPRIPGSPGAGSSVSAARTVAAADLSSRWLFPTLESQPIGADSSDLVTTDYTLSFNQGELTGGLTGVERDPSAVTDKANMAYTVTVATPTLKQFAVVVEDLPAKLWDSQSSLQALFENQVAQQLSRTFDAKVVGQIQSAGPLNSNSGTGLVARIRNGISKFADLGGEPTVIGLTPSDAATLDLETDAGGYVFIPGTDAQATVWKLLVREVPGLSAPLLVDPAKLGLVYTGESSVLVDPYSGMKKNTVRVRVETEAILHIRSIQQGAYRLA
jgi:hypothetical protein